MKATAKPCPVLALAYEYDKLTRAYCDLDSQRDDPTSELKMSIIWNRLDAIASQVSYLSATCADGAAFQIMIANSVLDIVRAGKGKYLRRSANAQMTRLLYAAVNYLATGDKKIADATQHLMGSHIDPADILSDVEAQQ